MTDALELVMRARAAIALDEKPAALALLRQAAPGTPPLAQAWRVLGDAFHAAGDVAAGGRAYLQSVALSVRDPELAAAAAAMAEDRLADAEPILRTRLKQHHDDVAALRMLAEIATRLGRYDDAEPVLTRVLALAPEFLPARHNLGVVLYRTGRSVEALAESDRLIAADPANPAYRNLKAAVLVRVGRYDEAVAIYQDVLAAQPDQPNVWMSMGHALKTLGRIDESIAAYRRSVELRPSLGESWWSLANLKTFRFTVDDIAALRAALAQDDLAADDRFHFEFALGKALEDAHDYADAFAHYRAGNAQRRALVEYDPAELTAQRERMAALFTPAFFAARGGGAPDPDPIFVVGLQRSGSTLVEQILASHPLIEGTMELPDIPAIARRLSGRKFRDDSNAYPDVLGTLNADALRELGEEYLSRTRVQRKTDRPFFVDKLPNNFVHWGLIKLILPNARMVDVRRHPMACCFSCYKQHFARGQAFTYDLGELGGYYRDYVGIMDLADQVLPGHVHRVIYERLVADTEGQVRALLAYLGVPFDPACLAFYETDRPVRTPSAEQVRQPIYAGGLDQWRHFAPWLEPLADALGPVLDDWQGEASAPQ